MITMIEGPFHVIGLSLFEEVKNSYTSSKIQILSLFCQLQIT